MPSTENSATSPDARCSGLTARRRACQSRSPLVSNRPANSSLAALARASAEIADHGGGTRLGDTIRTFNDEWGVRGLARGATVVVCSDGWDRGDPTLLGAQVERLSRVTHRLVWVNPLKASDGYAPLAGGMAAALPHVDHFVAGHSLHALEHLAEVIAA